MDHLSRTPARCRSAAHPSHRYEVLTTAPLPGQARSTAASGFRGRRRTAALLALVALTGLGPLTRSAAAYGPAPHSGRDFVQAGGAPTTSVSSVQHDKLGRPAHRHLHWTRRNDLPRPSLADRQGPESAHRHASPRSCSAPSSTPSRRGARQTVRITLNPRGRALLANHTWLKVRVQAHGDCRPRRRDVQHDDDHPARTRGVNAGSRLRPVSRRAHRVMAKTRRPA